MSDDVAVDPRLLEILACPACHGSVRQVDDTIRCEQCRRVYPVRGVPVMLVEESTPGA
jgi:uncharacterized protein YbaR (Trm112 family)